MTSLNWLDRAIASVAPGWGARRVQARAMIAALAYEGARTGRRDDGWRTKSGSSADSEITQHMSLLRDRARDLVRNNPHAAKGLAVLVANKIGSGIMCQPAEVLADGRRTNRRKNDRLVERWKRWADRCEVSGKLDLFGVQSLAERTRAEAGEALIRFLPVRMEDGLDVPFRLQVLEPDLLDSTRHQRAPNGNLIKHGIEYAGGRPVAYWLYDAHPGDDAPVLRRGGFQSTRVPASEVIHYFKPLRPGQTRGVTDFAPVMIRLRALDSYDDAEVMRKRVAACIAAFVTSAADLPAVSIGGTSTDEDGRRIEQLSPGQIAYLKHGESVAFADPKPSSDYEAFTKVQIRAIAAGLVLPYELLSGDHSDANYTTYRMALIQMRAEIEKDQWQLLVPQVCGPICRRFTNEAALIDSMIDPRTAWDFTPPRFMLLDPAKEVPALIQAIQSGIDSYPNVVRREGYDWREKLAEAKEAQDYAKELGLELTSMPGTQPKTAPAPASRAPEEADDEETEAQDDETDEAA